MDLDGIYRHIGRQYVLNYAGKGGSGKKKPTCKKGWNCGYTCLPRTKENCKSPLKGQSATYADWLSKQEKKSSKSSSSITKAKTPSQSKSKTPRDIADGLAKDPNIKQFISLVTNSRKSDKQVIKEMGISTDEALKMVSNIRKTLKVAPGQTLKQRLVEIYKD